MNSRLFVYELASLPVAYIHIDRDQDQYYVDYGLDSVICELGWDARLVRLGLEMMRRAEPTLLQAKVAVSNKMPSFYGRLKFIKNSNVHKKKASHSIAILSDRTSWMNDCIQELMLDWLSEGHRVQWVHDKYELRPGEFCFYLSCGQIVSPDILSQYKHNLVIHESDLPQGKGWSPLTWQILEGKNKIPVTLFEAAEKVDSGVIYAQDWIEFEGYELIDELRENQAKITMSLCKRFVNNYPQIFEGRYEQVGDESFYPRRHEIDSALDPSQPIETQFNLLRVVDNTRYPAFFYLNGQRYFLRIDRVRPPADEQGMQYD